MSDKITIYKVGYLKNNITGKIQSVWMTEPKYDEEGRLKPSRMFVEIST